MTRLDVPVQNLAHPLQRLKNPGILDHDVAVVMAPTQIVGAMVQDAESQLSNVEQIQLCDRQVRDLAPFGSSAGWSNWHPCICGP